MSWVWLHGVECPGIRFKECHVKYYISVDKTCHWNERIILALTKHCNNTDTYYMNMRVILLLHLFNISASKTLDLNYIAYMKKWTNAQEGIQEAALLFFYLHAPVYQKEPLCPV